MLGIYDGTDTRAFALLIGAALALALPRDRAFGAISVSARRLLEVVGGAALVGVFVMFWRTNEYSPFLYQGGMVLFSVLCAFTIAVTVHPGARLGTVLGWKPLRWIGERSYGIYLWHYPVIVLTTPVGAGPSAIRDVLQIAASIALAALSWKYVEQPVRHGALRRQWNRFRERGWTWPRLRPAGWVVSGAVVANIVVCIIGLAGVVAAPALAAATKDHTVIPPRHHHVGTTTTTVTAPGTNPSPTTTAPVPAGQGVTAIGDSIMVDASTDLEAMLPGIVIDAKVGQQLYQVQSTVPQLKANGDIGNRLILELGTNGPYSTTQLETLLNSLGPMKRIVLVNTRVPRPWQTQVNATIATVAAHYPNATLVNWFADSANSPQYFYTDGIHLNPAGAQYYASLIVQALDAPAPPPSR